MNLNTAEIASKNDAKPYILGFGLVGHLESNDCNRISDFSTLATAY